MYKFGEKLIATIIVTIILLAQLSLIGIYGNQIYATNETATTNELQNSNTQTNTETDDEISVKLENNLIKFMKFSNSGKQGILVQTKINSGIIENKVATTKTYIKVTSPKINGKAADEIKVTANNTEATNGDKTGVNFTNDNYKINQNDGYVEITVKNEPDQQGKISWVKNVEDEYIMTYVYYLTDEQLESIYNNTQLVLIAVSKISTNDKKIITKNTSSTQTVTEQVGNLIDFSLSKVTEAIGKGFIYTNYDLENKTESVYNETITADLGLTSVKNGESDLSFIDKLIIDQGNDPLIDIVTIEPVNGTETGISPIYTGPTNTYYKNITINKEIFNKFFGNDGYIKIYNGATLIGTINKDTVVDEQQNMKIDLSELNVSKIQVETSKPLIEGKLELNITKAIKSNLTYTKQQVERLHFLSLYISAKAMVSNTEINSKGISKLIQLLEPENKTSISLNKEKLSTIVTNKDVEIKAVLKTDSDTCLLYDNPTVKITLPKYIENINVKSAQLLFDQELTIKNAEYEKNADGTTSIIIQLQGKQTKYDIGAISGGANIVIVADIDVNRLTPSKQENIVMESFDKVQTKISEATVPVSFTAPTGIISTNAISNYAEGEGTLRAITNEEIGAIDTGAESRIATFNMDMVNNYENTISNINILGRIPYQGNKTILTNNDLKSTFGLKLLEKLNVQVVDSNGNNINTMNKTIYYSENGEATQDVTLNSNGWTTDPVSLDNIKSYLIVCEGAELNIGDIVSFSYNAEIPANLEYYQNAFETYAVYFNNNKATGTIQDKVESAKLGITTGESVLLEANLVSNIDETTYVQSGKFIKYTLTVKNTGTKISKNTIATVTLPECTTYIEFTNGEEYKSYSENKEIEINLGTINPNDTVTKDFWVVVKNIEITDICKDETHYEKTNDLTYHLDKYKHDVSEYRKEVFTKAIITADELIKPIQTNQAINKISKSFFDIQSYLTDSTGIVQNEGNSEGKEYQYNLQVSLTNDCGDITAKNTIIEIKVPDGAIYQNAQIEEFQYNVDEDGNIIKNQTEIITDGITYNNINQTITINLGDVKTNSSNRKIVVKLKTDELTDGKYEKDIIHTAAVTADGYIKEKSKDIILKYGKKAINVYQTCNITNERRVMTGDKINYTIVVENIGGTDITQLNVEDIIPKELQFIDGKYTLNEFENYISNINEDNILTVDITIPKGEKLTIYINTIVKEVAKDTQIQNVAKISADGIEGKETNIIKHTIEKTEYVIIDNPETITRKITGQVWIDKNKDGIKDEDEEKLSGVKVMLYNNNTNTLVVDSSAQTILTSISDNEGMYTFKNIPKGNYTAIFMYDTSNYSSTTYRKDGASEEKNSDAIDTKLTIDGESKVAAITEPIILEENNIYNIDLGLILNPKFDLKLDKTVSEITVQNAEGTTINQFNDTKLAKQEIVGKYVDNTTLIIKYNIKVTNEGAVDGYVKKIADYISTNLGFSTELNKDWYTVENGIILNSSLANTKLAPGESRTVSLLLTMKTSDSKLGTVNNQAEIYEASNDLGLEDIDSVQANKSSNEDDMSQAQVLISIKTGEAIMFIGLAIAIVVIIGTGVYFIKKKVIK